MMQPWPKEFDWNRLTPEDRDMGHHILEVCRNRWCNGGPEPDLTISPAGTPYLYRWNVVRSMKEVRTPNVYFHVQVAHDPERPLHDHPWDNQSVILSGGYGEVMCAEGGRPTQRNTASFRRKKGDVIWRKADWSHRLFLPAGVPYTMTLFSTGPKSRNWGFWYDERWIPYQEVTRVVDGESVHYKPGDVVGAY